MSYSILKVPVSKEKTVFYYYKPYQASNSDTASIANPPPEDRSLYVVHFDQEIREDFILKTFSGAGTIKQTHIGSFKPRASKKKGKRTLYFAIVVYKESESLDKIAHDPTFLQGRVNKVAQKQARYHENPFLSAELNAVDQEESSENEEDMKKRQLREIMEADGFTMVAPESEVNKNRVKVRDKLGFNTVYGIDQEEARRIYDEQQKKKKDQAVYISGKEQKELIKRDFYSFQKRLVQKSDIAKLQESFETDKKRMQKAIDKANTKKNLRQ